MSYEAGTCSALSTTSQSGPVAAAVRTRRRPSPYESAGSNCRVAEPRGHPEHREAGRRRDAVPKRPQVRAREAWHLFERVRGELAY